MKKYFFIVLTLLAAQLMAQENLFDFRLSTAGANPNYTLIHNNKNWQGFVQASTDYMLWEIGPRLAIKNLNITGRVGINFGYGSGNLTIDPQLALVLSANWRNWRLFSINEYTPVKGIEYYYEQNMAYKNFGLHLEAIYQNGAYQPFIGLMVSLPVSKGDIFFWLAQKWGTKQKLARVGYQIFF